MTSYRAAIAAFAALLAATPAFANDSTAELSTGGLIFVRNQDVEMRSEELTISTKQIDVRYRFFNRSDKDVTVLVAFPMPDINGDDEQIDNLAVPTEDPVNILNFATTVDGKPVKTAVEQRVSALGIDRTDMLRSLNVPFAPHLPSTDDALTRLPKDKWEELIRLGIAEVVESDSGKGMEQRLSARWTLRTTFYWQQTFPAKKEVVIEHRYTPSVGQSVQTFLADPDNEGEDGFEEFQQKYCLEKSFYDAVARATKITKSQNGAPFSEHRIEYILKTGGNWAGPIGDFRLVIDKGEASSLLSFCGDDVKRLSPTRFEIRLTDFVPESDLSILILRRLPKQ
jgi:hypothetical protein